MMTTWVECKPSAGQPTKGGRRRRARYRGSRRIAVLTTAAAARQGWRCYWCRCPLTRLTATTEHLVPLSRGGALTAPDNIAAACRDCNGAKGDLTAAEYRGTGAYRARLLRSQCHRNAHDPERCRFGFGGCHRWSPPVRRQLAAEGWGQPFTAAELAAVLGGAAPLPERALVALVVSGLSLAEAVAVERRHVHVHTRGVARVCVHVSSRGANWTHAPILGTAGDVLAALCLTTTGAQRTPLLGFDVPTARHALRHVGGYTGPTLAEWLSAGAPLASYSHGTGVLVDEARCARTAAFGGPLDMQRPALPYPTFAAAIEAARVLAARRFLRAVHPTPTPPAAVIVLRPHLPALSRLAGVA
jgi:HNH endonuclease